MQGCAGVQYAIRWWGKEIWSRSCGRGLGGLWFGGGAGKK